MLSQATEILSKVCIKQEVANAPLGDKRRSERYVDVLEQLVRKPEASIPEAMRDQAALEAYYRLMRNEAVDHFSLLEPHFEGTRSRCESLGNILVAHDTTEFAFDIHDEPARENLAKLSANRQGFLWHASLAITADEFLAPMGIVASRPFVHASQLADEQAVKMWTEIDGILDNEQRRWMEAVEAAEDRLGSVHQVIHIMDREGDDYCTLFPMVVSGYSFVVRMVGDRNICDGARRCDKRPLAEALDEAPWSEDERDVLLSARPKGKAKQGHPVRRARKTRLKLRAKTIELRRPNHVPAEQAPARLEVHVVEVLEISPPHGEEPVRWLLVTDQPIDTAEACWQIVDWYRARWQIEEYFKALKTGAAYSKLQHKRAQTLLAALSAKAVVAWNLLVLRHVGRYMGEGDALAAVTPMQLQVLRALKPKIIGPSPTAAQAMKAIAQLGGHIRQNGPPGWQTLGRGWSHLRDVEHGFRLALQGNQEM